MERADVLVVGYALDTVWGDESTLDLFTDRSPMSADGTWQRIWSDGGPTSVEEFDERIVGVVRRAVRSAGLPARPDARRSLVVGSNFFHNRFWEHHREPGMTTFPARLRDILVREFGINGMVADTSTACSSGGSAIIIASQLIESNESDEVIVLGFDVASRSPNLGMSSIGALATDIVRPFSAGRKGTTLADGIGALVMSNKAPDVGNHVVVAGYGAAADAYNATSPRPDGESLRRAMTRCLDRAGVRPDQVDYINTHGSGTVMNDSLETRVVKNVFGAHAKNLRMNASKSLIGHTLGAAGLVECILTVMQMQQGVLHATIGFTEPDPQCDLDNLTDGWVHADPRFAMTTSIGFGGLNVCLLLRKVTHA